MARSKPKLVRPSKRQRVTHDDTDDGVVRDTAAPPAPVACETPAPVRASVKVPLVSLHAERHATVQRVKAEAGARASAWVFLARERWAARSSIRRWHYLQVFARYLHAAALTGRVAPLVGTQCAKLCEMLRSACHDAVYMHDAGAMFPHTAGLLLVRRLKVARDVCVRAAWAGGSPSSAAPPDVAAHQASSAFVTALMSAPPAPLGVAPSLSDVRAYVLRHLHSVSEIAACAGAATDASVPPTFTMDDDFLADLFARDYASVSVADVAEMFLAGATPLLSSLPFDCHIEIGRLLTQVLDGCVNANAACALPSATLENVVMLTTIWAALTSAERAAQRQ